MAVVPRILSSSSVVPIMAILMCGFLVFASHWQWRQRGIGLAAQSRELEVRSDALGDRAARALDAIDIVLIATSQAMDRPDQGPTAHRVMADRLPQLRSLWSVDVAGNVKFHSAGNPGVMPAETVAALIEGQRDGRDVVRVSPLSREPHPADAAIRMSRPLIDAAGGLRAVIVADFDSSFVIDPAAHHDLRHNTVALIDRAGDIVAGGADLDARSLLRRVLRAHDQSVGGGAVSADGAVGRIVALPSFGLRIVVAASTDAPLAQWRANTLYAWFFALAAAGLAILLFVWLRLAGRLSRGAPGGLEDSERRLSSAIDALPMANGGIVGVRTDTTKLKRAEARASQAEMRLVGALDATSDGWHIWDAEDRLILVNRAAQTAVSNPEDFSIGVTFADALRACIRRGQFPEAAGREEAFVEVWVARRKRREPHVMELRRADGCWVHLREHPTREGGMVDVIADITERKQWEKKLQAARSGAERANRAKSDFLSNMSHELRTPLNAVLGFSQLLLFEPGGDPLSAEQREAALSIERTGRHLLNLVEDILDLARIESSAIELSIATLAPGELCAQVVDLMRPAAAAAGVELILQSTPADMPDVSSDAKRVLQIMTNFVSNAIKYGAEGERIEIGAEVAEGGEVRFLVRDYGPGIMPDRQAQLFRPFSRAGKERTNIEGTGIGLSIAKGLADRLGGRIGVDSQLEYGATFWFSLPARASEVDMTTQTPTPQPAGNSISLDQVGRATVLYIEDTPENLALVRRLLARYANITYLEAESAELGLEMARREKPDIILMDMRLPGMSGIDALKALRADPAIAGITVIGLTGAAMPHEAEEIAVAGFDGYITKPFRIAHLLAVLAEKLSRRTVADPPKATA